MSKLCFGCMSHYSDEYTSCPYCGYEEGTPRQNMMHLEPGTILHARYMLGKVLGYGGFGVTYLAWDLISDTKAAIKEYLPNGLATRQPDETQVQVYSTKNEGIYKGGLERFMKEARQLKQFRDVDGIVKIHDCFAENGTAYLVMEYLDGETLGEKLKREKKITPEEAAEIVLPLTKALETVHASGIIHRDISPDNIYLTKDGKVHLIDFGSARYDTSSGNNNFTVMIKHGYSPIEQYQSNSSQGSYTDVYALAATMYRAITGVIPPNSIERLSVMKTNGTDTLEPVRKLCPEASEKLEEVLTKALSLDQSERTQTMERFEKELREAFGSGGKILSWSDGGEDVKTYRKQPGKKSKAGILAVILSVAVVILGIVVGMKWRSRPVGVSYVIDLTPEETENIDEARDINIIDEAGDINIKVVEIELTHEEYAICVDKDQPELLAKVNEVIAKIMADGTFDDICNKYFGDGTPTAVASAALDDSKDQLVVATNAAFAPFEYTEGDSYYGIDMEIASLIAQELGWELVISNMEFDAVCLSVGQHKCDIAMAGLTVREDRKEYVDFSDSYYAASQKVIVKEDDATFANCKTADDVIAILNSYDSTTKIGVQNGTTGQFFVKGDADWGFDGFAVECVGYQNGSLAVQDLINGNLALVIIDSAPAAVLTAGDRVMNYMEYIAAALDTEVVVETYVQAKQSWWEDKATVYSQDKDGAYFLYNMACSEADYAKLTPGTKIKVTGFKSEWAGEVEISDATFAIEDGNYIAPAFDATALLGTDDLIKHQNEFVSFKGLTVDSIEFKNGEPGDDIYVNLAKDGAVYSFCVEFYLTGTDTDVYKAVSELQAGDVIDVEGFLYWYNGANPHITSVTKIN